MNPFRRTPSPLRRNAPMRRAWLRAAFLLALVSLAPLPASAETAAVAGRALDLFQRSQVDQILAKNPTDARAALVAFFPQIRGQNGGLASLCTYLDSIKGKPITRPLLAIALIADQQYAAATKVLAELENDPVEGAWASSELARVRQLIDVQKAWNQLASGDDLGALLPAEKERIEAILRLDPAEARAAMAEACQDLLEKHGDLAPLLGHLRTLPENPQRQVMLALAAVANGDVRGAEQALSALAEEPAADAQLLAELGRLKEMRGKTAEALGLFKRALERIDDADARFALGIRIAQLLYTEGKPEEAGETLRALAKDGAERRNFCARIAGMHGDLALVTALFEPAGKGKDLRQDQLYLGEALLRLGEAEAARPLFEAALRLSELPRDRRYILDRLVAAARATHSLPALMDTWLAADDLTAEQVEIMAGILGGELGRIGEVFTLLERSELPEKTRDFLESPAFQERLVALASGSDRAGDVSRTYRDLIARHPEETSYRDGYVRLLLMEGDRPEAIRVYREAIAASRDQGALLRIAAGARRTGLREVAIEAATKGGEMLGASPLQAGLFMVNLFREQGETDRAIETLRQLERGHGGAEPEGMMALSQSFERLGLGTDAIRLCRKAWETSGSERTLRKLITLLEENKQQGEAFVLWRKLWETAEEPMTVIQASDRLLEIGARNGKLADLAIELEDRIGGDGLRERELTLLLDIYTSVGDPVSAADVIMELPESQAGGNIATYQRLLKVYMESELFGRCNELLRKLIEIDPENRDEHLQLLAVIALERRNNGDAMVVLEELAGRSGDGILRDSFSASVLDMLGKHLAAARAHRRSLAANPDEVESWLLWGNALAARDAKERAEFQAAGERPPAPQEQEGNRQTRGLFTVLLEEAEADDLFVICIDGLLNARAPRHTMLNALRRLNERIAANPGNLLLYQLAMDLNEEIQRPRDGARALEMSLAIADDSRAVIIRELMTMAQSAQRGEEVIEYGRSLLNITEHLPPDDCLSLGTMLLERGHFAEAEAAFQRVVSDANALGAARDVALRYENAGLFDKAARVIRTLMIGNPYDVELQLRLALLEEKRGDFAKAGESFSRALDMMISRLPQRDDDGAATDTSGRNVDGTGLFRDLAVRGLITSALTPEDSRRLVASLRATIQAEIENLAANDAFAADISGNPRLHQRSLLLRRIGLVLHHPDEVDEMDAELFRRYPGDGRLRGDVAAARQQWQTRIDASRSLARHGIGDVKKSLADTFADGRDAVAALLETKPLSPAERSEAAALLAIFGHDDLIDTALAGCDLGLVPQENGALLVTAALAAKRPDLMREVILTNLNRLRRELEPLAGFDRSRAYLRPTLIYKQIVAAWPILSPQDRSTIANLFGMCIEPSEGTSAFQGAHHFLLSLAGRADEITVKRLRHYLDSGGHYLHGHVATILDRWLGDRPAAARPAALRELLGEKSGEARSIALRQLARYLSEETLTDELRREFPELAARPGDFPAAPEPEAMAAERERFAAEITAGLRKADTDFRQIFPLHDITLRRAASMLPAAHLDLLLEGYIGSRDPARMLVAFLLLRQAGREAEALPLLENLAALPADDPKAEAVLAALPVFLIQCGWDIPALAVMRRNSTAPVRDPALGFALHDPLVLLDVTGGNLLDAGARRIHASRLMASPEQFRQAARIYHADTRHPDIASEHQSQVQATRWPARMSEKPGGLLGWQPRTRSSVLADVVKLDGGQDELMRWLRSLTPSLYSSEGEICERIAEDAAARGLSPRILQDLRTAAARSALTGFDITLIGALARKAPASLPDGLAPQMEKLALHDWKGETGLDPRYAQARKDMGMHEDRAETMGSIATASRSVGRPDLAAPLGRWSVAMDLMEEGSSPYLPAYLASLPDGARQQALADLRPFLGLHEARPVTGDGLGALLQTLLGEGMTEMANETADRYLRHRFGAPTSSLSSSTYLSLIGGFEADPAANDDAVALALARLGRPEDYHRLLWKKNFAARIVRHPLNLGTNIAPEPLLDDTAALPEPSEVADIGRYLDIHLAVGEQLRREGVLSPESHVARICLLGRWCAARGLDERAAALLETAVELSTGMLTGRLWVADLQRLLGKNAEAEEIELELLRRNLLPMPRLPAALAALARTSGQAAADAAAFRLTRFTNHPEALAPALRHVLGEEMKQEYLDLAERRREVGTLFLPASAPCPFEGYDSIAGWSAAIAATAARLPDTPRPRELAALADDEHPAISRVVIKGDRPEIIYVPILHDDEYSHLSADGTADIRKVMEACEEIAERLYRRYGVRHILLEGLGKQFVDQYNRIPLERRNIIGNNDTGMIVHRTWTRLLAEKSWMLVPASDRPLVGPLTALGREYEPRIVAALDEAKTSGWLRNREAYQANKPALDAKMKAIADEYNAKHRMLLKGDPGLKHEYDVTVTMRNRMFLENLLAQDEPGVVFFGASHWQDLEQQLERRGVSYAVVVPAGVSWPREIMDDDDIFSDMLELGASLSKANLTLGDGTRETLTIPIEGAD